LQSLSVKDRTKQWHKTLTGDSIGINLVVEYQNVISGFCVYGPIRDNDLKDLKVGELLAININPDLWRFGLGSGLLKEVIKGSKNKHWQSIYLWVIKENNRARRFYESHGFEPDGFERTDTELTNHELHEIRYKLKLI